MTKETLMASTIVYIYLYLYSSYIAHYFLEIFEFKCCNFVDMAVKNYL